MQPVKEAVSLGILLVAASGVGAQVHVPADYATIQDAIDGVAAGTVIVVNGGTYDAIVIDKAITLVGDPMPTIDDTYSETVPYEQDPCIRLAGTGTGTVTLVRIRTYGYADGSHYASAGEGILGGGFDRLVVAHSEIRASDTCCDDHMAGVPAISTSVPYVLVSDSYVEGGEQTPDDQGGWAYLQNGGDGILAPTSTVTLLDSEVVGGKAFDSLDGPDCFTSCADLAGGYGGRGVVVDVLFKVNSTVTGGEGGSYGCMSMPPVCDVPDGVAIVANETIPLPHLLEGSGALDQGASWTLSWFSVGNPALLLASAAPIEPALAGSKGWLFLDPTALSIFAIPGGGVGSLTLTVPVDISQVGATVHVQVYDPVLGLTAPVVAGIVP